MNHARSSLPTRALLVATLAAFGSGCAAMQTCTFPPTAAGDVPRELSMASLPPYRVSPPDILLVEVVRNIRLPGSTMQAGDQITIRLANPEPLEPIDPNINPIEAQFRAELEARFKIINGDYVIQPGGTVDLGPVYGEVTVAGLTPEQAERAIAEHLKAYTKTPEGTPAGLMQPQVSVTWTDLLGKQAVTGEHLVRPDGSVSLGVYGSVHVAGKSLDEVRILIQDHLSRHILNPEVNVDVVAYNSRVYYVVMDGGGYGERVVKLPITGNETVMDAIAAVEGLSQVSSKKIWLARPAPAGRGCAQILPIHWNDIASEGITDTNYQILPGDRIYVKADHFIAFDNFVAKVTSPFERMFGFTLLGTSTAKAIRFYHVPSGSGSGGSR